MPEKAYAAPGSFVVWNCTCFTAPAILVCHINVVEWLVLAGNILNLPPSISIIHASISLRTVSQFKERFRNIIAHSWHIFGSKASHT